MAMITIARAAKDDGVLVVALDPGGVKVEKLTNFNVPGFMEPEESVLGMMKVIENLTPEQSGLFIDWQGRIQQW